jgi:hypothetical protein
VLRAILDGAFVVLGLAEVEEHAGVVHVALELLETLEAALDGRAAARVRLRLLGVVPKPGGERGVREGLELRLQSRDVKETPLAP